jgi:L-2-hydroxycarboxylate dehydrogenase (NAD+)
MSISGIALGTVLHRKETGEGLPEGVALDTDSEPATDSATGSNEIIVSFGGPKSSGLAIAVEILAGSVVGAAMGQDVTSTYHTEEPCTKDNLFVALDPPVLSGGDFAETANSFLRNLKPAETAAGFDDIRLPGKHSIARDWTSVTVEVDNDLWDGIRNFGGDV